MRKGSSSEPGISLASRRLSIVGLADGQQPMTNEDRSVFVVFNGELFDHVERRERTGRAKAIDSSLTATRKSFRISGKIIAKAMWERLRGQFAIALWDEQQRQLHLGRDRFGIAPLVLEPAGRLAALRLGDQRPARLGDGARAARPQGARSCLHLFRGAGSADLF